MDYVLCHHGIKGQKWGVRRYQNPDGSLTPEGKRKYGSLENFNKANRRRTAAIAIGGAALATGAVIAAKTHSKEINDGYKAVRAKMISGVSHIRRENARAKTAGKIGKAMGRLAGVGYVSDNAERLGELGSIATIGASGFAGKSAARAGYRYTSIRMHKSVNSLLKSTGAKKLVDTAKQGAIDSLITSFKSKGMSEPEAIVFAIKTLSGR